jgi:hypothetical protein
MNSEFIKTYKTNTGASILHSAAASNSFELVTLLVQKHPQLVHSFDNYGRTPLFWSFWSGGCLTSTFLLSQGAKLNQQDEVGDTPLHISSQTGNYEATKQILFWILHNDAEYKSQAKLLLHCMNLKNNAGVSPVELSIKKKDQQMTNLYKAIEELCQEKLKLVQDWTFVQDITMRSGPYNGKQVSKMDNTVSAVRLQLEDEFLIMNFYRNNGKDMKVKMNLKKIAFIILEKTQVQMEITLAQIPEVTCFVDQEWKTMTNSIFDSGLSFHCKLNNSADLDKIYSYLLQGDTMTKFQDYCFCYKPTDSISVKKESGSVTPINKSGMSSLREKLNRLSLKNSPTILNNENNHLSTSPSSQVKFCK